MSNPKLFWDNGANEMGIMFVFPLVTGGQVIPYTLPLTANDARELLASIENRTIERRDGHYHITLKLQVMADHESLMAMKEHLVNVISELKGQQKVETQWGAPLLKWPDGEEDDG